MHDTAFNLLKQALCTNPLLALPDFSLPFHIETDAYQLGIGAILQQNGHPLAFISKALSPCNQGLSVYEKEYLAIFFLENTGELCFIILRIPRQQCLTRTPTNTHLHTHKQTPTPTGSRITNILEKETHQTTTNS